MCEKFNDFVFYTNITNFLTSRLIKHKCTGIFSLKM